MDSQLRLSRSTIWGFVGALLLGTAACSHGRSLSECSSLENCSAVVDLRGKTSQLADGRHDVHAFVDGPTLTVAKQGRRVNWTIGGKPMTELKKGPLCYDCECGIDCPLTPGHCVRVTCDDDQGTGSE